jgi:hypothetical protein
MILNPLKLTLELRPNKSLLMKFEGDLIGATLVSDVNTSEDLAKAIQDYLPRMYEDALKNSPKEVAA